MIITRSQCHCSLVYLPILGEVDLRQQCVKVKVKYNKFPSSQEKTLNVISVYLWATIRDNKVNLKTEHQIWNQKYFTFTQI